MNKTLVLLSLGRVLQIVILFLTSRIMTKLLSHEEVGFLYLLLSISSYIGLVIMNPIGVYFTRKLHEWSECKRSLSALSLTLGFVLITSLLSFPIIYIGKFFIGLNGNSWVSLSVLMSFFIFSTTMNNTLIPSLNILGFRISFVVLTFFTQLSGLICSYLMVRYDSTAFYWIVGQAISFFVWFVLALIFFMKKQGENLAYTELKASITNKNIKQINKFAFPISVTNISFWILSQSYRPIIENRIGLEFLGYIGLGFGLASSLSVAFEYLLQQFYYPEYYKKITNGNKSSRELSWNILFGKMLPLLLLMSIFIAFNSPFLIRILADEKFWDAWFFVSLGVVIEFFRMTNNILSLITQSEMNTKKTMLPYFVGGILSVVLVLASTSLNYKLYIPLSIITGNLCVFVLLFLRMKKIYEIKFPIKNLLIVCLTGLPYLILMNLKDVYTSYISTLVILTFTSLYFLCIGMCLFRKMEKQNA